MRTGIFLLVVFLLAIPCKAETIIVDPNGFADFDNIQDAINYSWDGDTVIVRPGTYSEQIRFMGRRITLTSVDPDDENIVNSTIITGETWTAVTIDFGEDLNSVITGFTITGSHGIDCVSSAPTISKNIIISGTGSSDHGISGCNGIITDNSISGYYCIKNSNGNISGNFIDADAYGIYNCNGDSNNNLIIADNVTYGFYGFNGNIYNNIIWSLKYGLKDCTGTIVNNTISNCSGFGIDPSSSTIVKNNIIANCGVGIMNICQNSFNCFWGNVSDFQGGSAGTGDFLRDPLFAGGSDFHLKSEAGRYNPSTETWVIDAQTSPCIDAGDPCSPIGVEPNPNGGRINIGAYGGTAQASKSTSGIVEPVCISPPAADLNGDCRVDLLDFAVMAGGWLDCGLDPQEACWE